VNISFTQTRFHYNSNQLILIQINLTMRLVTCEGFEESHIEDEIEVKLQKLGFLPKKNTNQKLIVLERGKIA